MTMASTMSLKVSTYQALGYILYKYCLFHLHDALAICQIITISLSFSGVSSYFFVWRIFLCDLILTNLLFIFTYIWGVSVCVCVCVCVCVYAQSLNCV